MTPSIQLEKQKAEVLSWLLELPGLRPVPKQRYELIKFLKKRRKGEVLD